MKAKELTRRQAVAGLLKTIAVAAGIKVTDLGKLLGATSTGALTKLKVLKFKLSGYNAQVFVTEFGRATPLKPISRASRTTAKPGQPAGQSTGAVQKPLKPVNPTGAVQKPLNPVNPMGCMANVGGGGFNNQACTGLENCGSNGSGNCPSLGECSDANVCSGQNFGGQDGDCGGVNDCNGETCGNLDSCNEYTCAGASCPSFRSCGTVHTCLQIDENNRVGNLSSTLNQFRTDPYVQGLLHYFNTSNINQLARQVDNMLQQRRSVMPSQIMR